MPHLRLGRFLVATALVLVAGQAPTSVAAASAPLPPAGSMCEDYAAGAMPLQWLIDLQTDLGPLSRRYDLPRLNERAVYCYGHRSLTVTAFSTSPEGLGGAVPYDLAPQWLDTWLSQTRFLAVGEAEAAPGAPAGPFLAVAVPPALLGRFEALRGQWVTVRLHFDDPVARTCRVPPPGAGLAGSTPSAEDLVDLCRQSPVVSSIAAARCPALPRTIAGIAAVPEALRAHCFAGQAIELDGRGGSVNNVWPGIQLAPGLSDWSFADSRGRSLYALVPSTLALPGPAGTPWENRDGVGGPDVWWHVAGHFGDARAAACTGGDGGSSGGDGISGPDFDVMIHRSDLDAVEFCRNQFTVESLVWLTTPPTDTDARVAARRADAAWLPAAAGLIWAVGLLLWRPRRAVRSPARAVPVAGEGPRTGR